MSLISQRIVTSLYYASTVGLCITLSACGAGTSAVGSSVVSSAESLKLASTVAVAVPTTYTITKISSNSTVDIPGNRQLNEKGQVTGYTTGFKSNSRAFFFDGTVDTVFGALCGEASFGRALNGNGQIVGSYNVGSGSHAFFYDGAGIKDLGTLGGSQSFASDINDNGQTVGTAETDIKGVFHAFLHDGTRMRDLGSLGGNTAVGRSINAHGQVVGFAENPGGFSHAFLYDGTIMKDLGTLGGSTSSAIAINARGQVTGTAFLANPAYHAFLYENNEMKDLGTLGGPYSSAVGINAGGQVAGNSGSKAFFYDGTSMKDLGSLGANTTEAAALNDNGHVVGLSSIPSNQPTNPTHAFIWSVQDGMVDLNSRLPNAPPGFQLTAALAISNSGYIVASSNDGLILLKPVN